MSALLEQLSAAAAGRRASAAEGLDGEERGGYGDSGCSRSGNFSCSRRVQYPIAARPPSNPPPLPGSAAAHRSCPFGRREHAPRHFAACGRVSWRLR